MRQQFIVHAVGQVRCARTEPIDDNRDAFPSTIDLDQSQLDPQALQGLESFSHVGVLYIFDQARDDEITSPARHPRGRADWPKVGVFAQRGKGRPNRIGATTCTVVCVEGTKLQVLGLDAIDATPVIDLKPVMSGGLPRGECKEPSWAVELMHGYWASSER